MTKQELLKAFEMRMEGYTYEEIGNELCYSGINIRHCLKRAYEGNKEGLRKLRSNEYIYPNLVHEIFKNHGSVRDFCLDADIALSTVHNALRGTSKPKLSTVQKLVKRTGKPMEYLFTTEESIK